VHFARCCSSCLRLTLVWWEWAQREAQATLELLKALPDGVEHELVLALLD